MRHNVFDSDSTETECDLDEMEEGGLASIPKREPVDTTAGEEVGVATSQGVSGVEPNAWPQEVVTSKAHIQATLAGVVLSPPPADAPTPGCGGEAKLSPLVKTTPQALGQTALPASEGSASAEVLATPKSRKGMTRARSTKTSSKDTVATRTRAQSSAPRNTRAKSKTVSYPGYHPPSLKNVAFFCVAGCRVQRREKGQKSERVEERL